MYPVCGQFFEFIGVCAGNAVLFFRRSRQSLKDLFCSRNRRHYDLSAVAKRVISEKLFLACQKTAEQKGIVLTPDDVRITCLGMSGVVVSDRLDRRLGFVAIDDFWFHFSWEFPDNSKVNPVVMEGIIREVVNSVDLIDLVPWVKEL